jgi:hypothetical protein
MGVITLQKEGFHTVDVVAVWFTITCKQKKHLQLQKNRLFSRFIPWFFYISFAAGFIYRSIFFGMQVFCYTQQRAYGLPSRVYQLKLPLSGMSS